MTGSGADLSASLPPFRSAHGRVADLA